MTFENKIVVGLQDIKAVVFECAKCKSRLSVAPEQARIPSKCPRPQCDQEWLSDVVETLSASTSAYVRLCTAISQIRGAKDRMPFTILLEFEGQPKEKDRL